MIILVLLTSFIVMLSILGSHEGWGKIFKVFGFLILTLIGLFVIERALHIQRETTSFGVLSILFWGLWDLGLILYNIKEGHISHF